jgi:hypothetical protein
MYLNFPHFPTFPVQLLSPFSPWEQELYSKSKYLPSHYWRYVDDIWGIWHHGLEKLQQFHKLANSRFVF